RAARSRMDLQPSIATARWSRSARTVFRRSPVTAASWTLLMPPPRECRRCRGRPLSANSPGHALRPPPPPPVDEAPCVRWPLCRGDWPGGGEGGSSLGSATPRDGRVRTVALGYQSREVGIRGRSGVRLPRRALHDRCAAFIGPSSLPPLVSGVTWSAVQLIGCR